MWLLAPRLLFPLAILVLYGRIANTVGLVTFPVASVLPVVLISALCCILVKLLSSRYYLLSYLSHFCPTRVSTKIRPFSVRGERPHRLVSGHSKEHLHMHYRDFNLLQGLARMVACLELFRTVIRPASLSLRLSANISCGHILMVLSSGPTVPISFIHLLGPVVVCALETLVCFVQCYVFYTLWRMYVGE